jgi:hypothetical protein
VRVGGHTYHGTQIKDTAIIITHENGSEGYILELPQRNDAHNVMNLFKFYG